MSTLKSLSEIQNIVNDEYVGFRPNKGGIKLVHIADGVFRTVYGKAYNPNKLLKIAFECDKKGNIPSGYDVEKVYQFLIDNEIIDKSVSIDSLQQVRPILKMALDADGGYFLPDKQGMRALSGTAIEFMTNETLYADAGDFMGAVIKKYVPSLASGINEALTTHTDSLSIIFSPLFGEEVEKDYSINAKFDDLQLWSKGQNLEFFDEAAVVGDCLALYAKNANKNNFLRWTVSYCSWFLVKYMASLEHMYNGGEKRPFLLDFSDDADNSIAKASLLSYTQIYQSISRFYEQAISNYLSRQGIDSKDLLQEETPRYQSGKDNKTEDLDNIWEIAKEDADGINNDEAMLIFGRSIFDMLALEANTHPLIYVRALGVKAGMFYPPVNFVPNKRFKLSADMLEVLLRGCIEPEEIITMTKLQTRLWERFNVIIGGRSEDEAILNKAGISIADKDALSKNSERFASMLEAMDFASIMADGILQIKVGGK